MQVFNKSEKMAKQAMVSQFSFELIYNVRHHLSVNNEGSEAL